jgi:hypothetical protein
VSLHAPRFVNPFRSTRLGPLIYIFVGTHTIHALLLVVHLVELVEHALDAVFRVAIAEKVECACTTGTAVVHRRLKPRLCHRYFFASLHLLNARV